MPQPGSGGRGDACRTGRWRRAASRGGYGHSARPASRPRRPCRRGSCEPSGLQTRLAEGLGRAGSESCGAARPVPKPGVRSRCASVSPRRWFRAEGAGEAAPGVSGLRDAREMAGGEPRGPSSRGGPQQAMPVTLRPDGEPGGGLGSGPAPGGGGGAGGHGSQGRSGSSCEVQTSRLFPRPHPRPPTIPTALVSRKGLSCVPRLPAGVEARPGPQRNPEPTAPVGLPGPFDMTFSSR